MARRRLSQRQKERIQKIQDRRRQRLSERIERVLEEVDGEAPQEGRVITRHGRNLAIADGSSGLLMHCLSRQNIGHVVCGDRVVWQPAGPGRGVVTAVLERDSVLSRPDYSGREKPIAANITQLVIVVAPQPEPSEYLIDQYLVAAETIRVNSLVALNKTDLLSADTASGIERRLAVYGSIGYSLVRVSAKREQGLVPLVDKLRGQTNILVGQSGVGKSSLVKALLPDLDIQIGKLSAATGAGRHTTSAATCYRLPDGGELIDSPGVRSFRLGRISKRQLELGFIEFRPYLGTCRFADCRHELEPDCAIREAVARKQISATRLTHFLHLASTLGV